MLSYDEVLNLNYYKKTTYTGWMGGMRFLIKREVEKDEEGKETGCFFHVFAWPGPYIFELTDAKKKRTAKFPFSEDGKKQAVDWLNEQYNDPNTKWPRSKIEV